MEEKPVSNVPVVLLGGFLALFGLEDDDKSKDEDPVVISLKRGMVARQRGDYTKAESMFHFALTLARQRVDHRAETYCYSLMADLALEQDLLVKAENLYLELMKRRIAEGSATDSNEIVEISLKLALIYERDGQLEKAEQGFNFCIDKQKAKILKIDIQRSDLSKEEIDTWLLYGMCMDSYGGVLIQKKKFLEALRLFTESYAISSKLQGELHPRTLNLYNQMAFCNLYSERYGVAVKLFEEVVEKTPEDSDELPVFLCNLGSAYAVVGDWVNAGKTCRRARDLAKQKGQMEALNEAKKCLSEVRASRKDGNGSDEAKEQS